MIRKLIICFMIVLLFASCSNQKKEETVDSDYLYDCWANFFYNKDIDSCQTYINALKAYKVVNFNSSPELRKRAELQMRFCLETSEDVLELLQTDSKSLIIYKMMDDIDAAMFSYLRDQIFILEDSHQKFVNYFLWLFATIIISSAILVFLNSRK